MLLWFKALHIVFVVTWFAGLFYLPRLFVYHAMSEDEISIARFKIMERKLLFGIMTPGAIFATALGIATLMCDPHYYLNASWFHIKLGAVLLVWIYHGYCIKYWWLFKNDRNKHSHVFYRYFNEIPVLLLFIIVILVVVKP